MTEFDVSHCMFNYDTPEGIGKDTTDDFYDWLDENIGPMTEKYGFSEPIMRKGQGWEIHTRKSDSEKLNKVTHKSYKVISWHLQIEDEQKAMLFALRWGIK